MSPAENSSIHAKKAPRYLDDIPLETARTRWFTALEGSGEISPFGGEKCRLDEALGRITSDSVWASISSPHYHASAMDGYALRSKDTEGATDTSPVLLRLGPKGPALPIDTGDPLPDWADCVVMIEATQQIGENEIEIRSHIAPWSSVRSLGEDMVATELVIPKNRKLNPVDLGAIAGSGHAYVMVRKKPTVGIIPTGTELVGHESSRDKAIQPGDIIEYNSLVLGAYVTEWGGIPKRYPPVADEVSSIRKAVESAAAENDCVVIIAGSSAGSEDFTETVINQTGSVLIHGVAIKPGHPVLLGTINTKGHTGSGGPERTAVPVLGAPGYPVSCALTAELFLEPLLSAWLGLPPKKKPVVSASFSKKVHSNPGLEEFLRVTLGKVGEKTIAAPLSRGAGIISSLVRADGIVRVPRLSEGIQAGENVEVELLREVSQIDRTILHIGSHDICLDLLAEFLAEQRFRFASSNAGSLGGIIAVKRGEAHLAGSHLLDPETGDYNTSYIRKYLPEMKVKCVGFVLREQGLILPKGNPKGITKIEDLAGGSFRFINRQRGAGTRVLFDYRLGQLGIAPEQIPGYEREEYTHLAVAAAVQSGRGDCGLGIAAAAHVLGLDFIPLEQERYELIIPEMFFNTEPIQMLLHVLGDTKFQKAVEKLPGYDTSRIGEVREAAPL